MTYVYAFIVGGLICVIGQLIMDYTKLTPAHVLVIFVTSGVILTAAYIFFRFVCFYI
ncbi:SpoVA/SpoVAEb family sporulation membrane protein [bacterium AH-315-E09]|nr:SpoVA/SpoVAEb family sporulation membrane protein [bacterium AH-315-E09]